MEMPLRAMLDTNVYEILFEKELDKIVKLIESKELIVYGCSVIRNELREIPKKVKRGGKSYRNTLLGIYDKLTEKHSYPVEKVIEALAEEFWNAYKSFKGGTPKRKILPDFLIVATATIHGLDLIVSEDDKTMKSRLAKKAFDCINKKNSLKTPAFISIKKLG